MKICFQPGRLGSKPNTLMRRWDVHPGGREVTPTNIQPILIPEQLANPTHATRTGQLSPNILPILEIMDQSWIMSEILAQLPQDPFSCSIIHALDGDDPPKGWTFQTEQLRFNGCLYVPNNTHLRLQIICNHHDHPTVGHLGQWKMINLIRCTFHWPGLLAMVRKYVRSCTTCARGKATCHKPYGLLKQLPIPT